MDPTEFGESTVPLLHAPYPAISSETLANANAGKVAVVTGAQRGIGAAIAEALAKSGANLAILDLTVESLEKTKAACEAHSVKVKAYACDVTDEKGVDDVFNKVEQELGPIDILVNNAGIIDMRPLLMATFNSFWRQIEVNFKGPMITMHNILPRYRNRGGGCIINIASRSGTVDVPMTMGYVTSKAALIRATHTLQRELTLDNLDPAIHLYALHPGGVLTQMGASENKDVVSKYGKGVDEATFSTMFKDSPSLCGQTCAFLASGRGKELRGLYLDCRQDVTRLLEKGREALFKDHINILGVNFLDGYANEV